MPLTFFLAQVFGLFCIVIGLQMVFQKKSFVKLINEMLKDSGLLYLTGIFALLIGLMMVLAHNVWDQGLLAALVSLIGWIALLKGLVIVLVPDEKFGRFMRTMKYESLALPYGIILILLGAYLTYAGFMG